MDTNNSSCCCKILTIVFSIILGIITGISFAFGQVPFITTAIGIMLALAFLILALLITGMYTAASHSRNLLASCFCHSTVFLLTGIIGTIITSIIALSVRLCIRSIFDIILVSIVTLFFIITLGGFICIILCIKEKLCCKVLRANDTDN
jgi:hypothetical protein